MGKLEGIAYKTVKRGSMLTTDETFVSPVSGITHDYRGLPGKRQVTVMTLEGFDLACKNLQKHLPWTIRRANLLISGIVLFETTGQKLQIGSLILEITGETEPCYRMDEQFEGLQAALQPDWRGGVTCRVLSAGHIRVGDEVNLFP